MRTKARERRIVGQTLHLLGRFLPLTVLWVVGRRGGEIEMVVIAACGVELSLAGRAARVGIEVGGDGEGGAAGAAEDGFFVEFGGGPGLNRMAGESDVAVLAGVKKTAALHLDSDDIQ